MKTWVKVVGGLLVLGALMQAFGPTGTSAPDVSTPTAAPTTLASVPPPLRIITTEMRALPGGGHAEIAVVPAGPHSKATLDSLIRWFRASRLSVRSVHLALYDDSLASIMHRAGLLDHLSSTEQKRHDAHLVATYLKNGNNGYESAQVCPRGVSEECLPVVLKY